MDSKGVALYSLRRPYYSVSLQLIHTAIFTLTNVGQIKKHRVSFVPL